MHLKRISREEMIVIVFLSSVAISAAVRDYGVCEEESNWNVFKCFDGTFIEKEHYCDKKTHCKDNSDEKYCKGTDLHQQNRGKYHPKHTTYKPSYSDRLFIYCSSESKYTYFPIEWLCDGFVDCRGGLDEDKCGETLQGQLNSKRRKAIEWLLNKIVSASATRKWGPLVHKTAVALYLSDPAFTTDRNLVKREITYELSIQLLSRLSQRRIHDVSSSDLASFINALLATCTDPREFHGFDLVKELRTRVEKQNYTNPYHLLALCNAGDFITKSDVRKLSGIFRNNNRELWTDTQAVALMALSCASEQADNVPQQTITELALKLKNHQYRNGTVENLLSTLLVMQALYAAETDADPDNFDEMKALNYILGNQKPDGSFGNLLLTYYALPVLSCKSMADISDKHCAEVPKDEDTAMFDLMNHVGPKVRIHYSVWIGMDKDIERTLTMRVPANTSFYGVMEIAAEIDYRYKFEYVVKNSKPYINAVSGIFDDSESGLFWFPYTFKDREATLLKNNVADMIPEAHDHIVMWYRKGSWIE